jgi:hypothetical protein
MSLVKFESLESKLITYNNQLVLLDKDVANLYGIEPKKLRQQLKRNIDKFPKDYAFIVTESELDSMVSQNVTPSKQSFGGSLPYVFTEKGLYMVATVLKTPQATNATFMIIETFANLKELSRNLNAIDENQTEEEQQTLILKSNELLEKVIDIEPVRKLKDDETEIETTIELNLGFVKVSRIVKVKKSSDKEIN